MKTGLIAHLNGEDIPTEEARLPFTDLGVAQGVAVTEMLRTFKHQVFRLDEHLARLKHSLEVVGWTEVLSDLPEIGESALRVVENNAFCINAADDLGVNIFVTGGPNPSYMGAQSSADVIRTIGIQTFPLRFERWAASYTEGVRLTVSNVKAMPRDVLDPTMKYRSRLHWFLADQEVSKRVPGTKAILIDHEENLTETSTGNFFAVVDDTLITPPDDIVLPGISRQVVTELAEKLGLPVRFQNLKPEDVGAAQEAFVTSTPYCILPVIEFAGKSVGNGQSGPLFEQLLLEWSRVVGVDIAAQAITNSQKFRS